MSLLSSWGLFLVAVLTPQDILIIADTSSDELRIAFLDLQVLQISWTKRASCLTDSLTVSSDAPNLGLGLKFSPLSSNSERPTVTYPAVRRRVIQHRQCDETVWPGLVHCRFRSAGQWFPYSSCGRICMLLNYYQDLDLGPWRGMSSALHDCFIVGLPF